MSKNRENSAISIGFFSLLGLIFITLKLCGVITWSWWLVTLPLWGVTAALLVILIVFTLVLVFKTFIYDDYRID